MLRITERTSGDVVVVDVCGRIAAGAPEIAIGHTIRSLLFRGYRKVIVNLEAATSSDASGVSALLGAQLDARAVGGELRLVQVACRMTNLCIIAALLRYFTVFESVEDAVAGFSNEPVARPVEREGSGWLEPVVAA